jgi:hypothetical protein
MRRFAGETEFSAPTGIPRPPPLRELDALDWPNVVDERVSARKLRLQLFCRCAEGRDGVGEPDGDSAP